MNDRGSVPDEFARRIGAAPPLPGNAPPEPQTTMDWALQWVRQGLHVFPCENYVGNPLVEKWHKAATNNSGHVAEFWSAFPDADIACVPDRSGHFVIGIIGKSGIASLQKLENQYGKLDPAFVVKNRWGNQFLFFNGMAISSHETIGLGVHVFGAGRYLFLPPSLTRIAEELPPNQWSNAAHA